MLHNSDLLDEGSCLWLGRREMELQVDHHARISQVANGNREEAALKIRDIMTDGVRAIGLQDSIALAAQKMQEEDLDCLVVVNEAEVVGVITDHDMALGCLVEGHDSRECRVFRHMTIQHDTADPDMYVSDAAILMMDKELGYIPVVENHRLVGLVHPEDITHAIDQEMTDRAW